MFFLFVLFSIVTKHFVFTSDPYLCCFCTHSGIPSWLLSEQARDLYAEISNLAQSVIGGTAHWRYCSSQWLLFFSDWFRCQKPVDCRHSACRVWWGRLLLLCFVVLSFAVLVCEKTQAASHFVSIQLAGKYSMCSQETVYTAFICHPRYHSIGLSAEGMKFTLVFSSLRFDRVVMENFWCHVLHCALSRLRHTAHCVLSMLKYHRWETKL